MVVFIFIWNLTKSLSKPFSLMAPSETRQYEDGSENHLGEEQEEILYGFFLGH